jgi:orotidine-5'-phosphate decarboxylase
VVALDFPEASPALDLAGRLLGRVAYVKVGLELFTSAGPSVVRALREMGHEVFLDLKLHDIPNTVARAAAAARRAGASLLTVHALGGRAMLEAALEGAEEGADDPAAGPLRLLGVTVLTSMDQAALAATGVAGHLDDQVLRLAALAAEAGLAGVVASAREAAQLRASHPPPFLIVTPGVRPAWQAQSHDQARVTTPRRAILAGADLVVVGRPLTEAPDPVEAAERIGRELFSGLAERRESGGEGRPGPLRPGGGEGHVAQRARKGEVVS